MSCKFLSPRPPAAAAGCLYVWQHRQNGCPAGDLITAQPASWIRLQELRVGQKKAVILKNTGCHTVIVELPSPSQVDPNNVRQCDGSAARFKVFRSFVNPSPGGSLKPQARLKTQFRVPSRPCHPAPGARSRGTARLLKLLRRRRCSNKPLKYHGSEGRPGRDSPQRCRSLPAAHCEWRPRG